MNSVNYMNNNNGDITMFCDQLPDKGFIDAVKIRNVCMASILTLEQKKQNQGGPDVDILQVTGERDRITKQQLINNYVHCNGKRINIHYLRSGKKYYIYNVCNPPERYKVLRIPDNCRGLLGEKDVNPGMYLVCKVDENGDINRETMYAISSKMFKKCFKIPAQAIIKKHIDKQPNTSFGLYNPRRLAEVRGFNRQNSVSNIERGYAQNGNASHQINIGTGMLGNPGNMNRQPVRMPQQRTVTPQNVQNRQLQQNRQVQQNQPQQSQPVATKRFTVTHRILSMHNKSLLGYVVVDRQNNESRQLNVQQTTEMCKKHLIDNLMLVTRENGIQFLKGNNMRIEMLPYILG